MPGFSWTELYTMPIDLRRFYYKATLDKIKKHNANVQEQNKQAKKSAPKIPRMPKINK
jgi:hypothetical protein